VKNAAEHARNLTSLLKKLPAGEGPAFAQADDPLAVLVLSFLMWESSTDRALAAYQQLMQQVVDFNDLRVCMPYEIAEILLPFGPMAEERSQRLRATLRDIYLREHAMSLDRLKSLGKRDARRLLKTLDGIVPYVAGRVMLLCFDAHAIPVDDQLCRRLAEAGAVDDEADVVEVTAWLGRQIKAGAGQKTHFTFQRWVDAAADAPRRSRRNPTGAATGSEATAATEADADA